MAITLDGSARTNDDKDYWSGKKKNISLFEVDEC